MYNTKGRLSYRSRIKFVVIKLREFSPPFAQAVDDLPEGLPWEKKIPKSAEELEEEKIAKADRGNKPVVIWIDYKRDAYQQSALNKETAIKFIGFHDDAEADDYTPRED